MFNEIFDDTFDIIEIIVAVVWIPETMCLTLSGLVNMSIYLVLKMLDYRHVLTLFLLSPSLSVIARVSLSKDSILFISLNNQFDFVTRTHAQCDYRFRPLLMADGTHALVYSSDINRVRVVCFLFND